MTSVFLMKNKRIRLLADKIMKLSAKIRKNKSAKKQTTKNKYGKFFNVSKKR